MKCDYCDEEATHNYQRTWVKYIIQKGEYKHRVDDFNGCKIEEPTGENNYHLCDHHAEMFEDTGYPY